MGYLILKNYKPQVVLAAAGIFLMMCGVWLGFGGVLDPTKSSGYLIVDIYNEILRMLPYSIQSFFIYVINIFLLQMETASELGIIQPLK